MKYLAHRSEDGKREQYVSEHLKNTAEIAGRFAQEFGCQSWGYLCGILHDVGKYSMKFQQRILGDHVQADHSTAGAQEAVKNKGFLAAYCIAGHHTGLPDGGSSADDGTAPTLSGRLKKKIPDYRAYREEIKVPIVKSPQIQMLTNGCFSASFFARMLYSCLVDADFLDTECFMKGKSRNIPKISMGTLWERLEKYIEPWVSGNEKGTLNARRTAILKACIEKGSGKQGIYSLTVPTGGGKTISSLAFALKHAVEHDLKRIIYVIPYTSIIEQNAGVFKHILGEEYILEHHSNVEYESAEGELDIRQLAAENWDIPVVVTTNVQFFESLYANKSSKCRKLHNISNSVLIFDEAQMLPVDFLLPCVYGICEMVLNYGCTAVLCTATQPSLQNMFVKKLYEKQLVCGEICPDVEEQYRAFCRVSLIKESELTKNELAERMKGEKQVLCILNTRSQVQEMYDLLKEMDGVFALSTYLYPEHRHKKLDEIRMRLKNGENCYVVATSLVEAGVDLDFQTVYRELSGLDSVIQAAGRCNREGRKSLESSRTYVFQFVKEERKRNDMLGQGMAVAEQIFDRYEDIGSPEAIHEYFDRLYYIKGDSLDKKDIVKKFDRATIQGIPFATAAGEFKIIDDTAKSILITTCREAREIENQLRYGERSRKLLRRAGRYSVNVYDKTYENLRAAGMLEEIDEEISVLRNMEQYSQEVGLKVDVERGDGVFF